MKEYIERFLEQHFQTDWKSCTDEQLYQALLSMTQEKTQQLPKRDEKGRKLYYLSAEFLVGRLLGNNLLNLGLYEQVDNLLQSQGRSLAAIEELEAEVEEYRTIGTPEECRAAVEKQTVKKVKSISQVKDGDSYVGLIGRCPCCGDILEEGTVYCDCGQKLDWNTDTVADQEDTEARR